MDTDINNLTNLFIMPKIILKQGLLKDFYYMEYDHEITFLFSTRKESQKYSNTNADICFFYATKLVEKYKIFKTLSEALKFTNSNLVNKYGKLTIKLLTN